MNLKSIKKCALCGEAFRLYRSTQKVCSSSCAIKLAKIPKRSKEEVLRMKELIEKTRTVPELLKKLESEFNRYIRIRDLGNDCISCNKKLTDIRYFHAGHYYSAGKHANVRFNENNVHGQCVECNTHLHGNPIPYRRKLEAKIGAEELKKLDEIAYLTKKWDREELIKLTKVYKLKNKINEIK